MADGTVVIDTNLDSTGFEKGIEKLKGTASKGAKLATAGISAVGSALMGLGGYAVKVGSDFEAGMSKVQAISGATSEDMEQLSAKAKEMGASTKFSATESAEAMQYMAMAGWKTQDMLDGIGGIMNLAAASGEDLASVSDIVTDALTAFGMSASDSGHFADVLAQASSNANTNVAMLGESFKYVAPVCGSMGYNAEDASIALGLMANSGIKASQAGMTLKNAIVNMASPTSNMQKVMDQYGLSLQNADGSMKSLKEVMDMLREKMGGLDQATQAAAASTLFGKESMAGMLAVINASPEDYDKLTNAIYNADGAAQQMADTMNDNLQGQITLLKSACEGLGIQLYESMDNPMKDIVKSANDMVSQLSQAFESGGFEGLTEELGTVFAEIVQGVAEYAPTLIDASVTVIQSFIQGIQENAESIASSGSDIINGLLTGIFEIAPELLNTGLQLIEYLAQGIGENLPQLTESAVTCIAEIVQGIVDNAPLILDGALALIQGLADGIINSIPVVIEALPEIIQGILDFFSSGAGDLLSVGSEIILQLVDGITQAIPDIIAVLPQIIQSLIDYFTSNMPQIAQSGVQVITGLIQGLTQAIPTLIGYLPQIIVAIVTGIVSNLPQIIMAGLQIIVALAKGLIQAIPQVVAAIPSIISALISALGSLASEFLQVGANAVAGLKNGIANAWEGICSWFKGKVKGLIDAAKSALDIHSPSRKFRDLVGKFIPLGIVEGIKATTGDLIASATNMAQAVINAVQEPFKNKDLAEAMVSQFRSASGTYEKLADELNSSQENYDWWSKRKVDDNEWYASAKSNLDAIKDKIKELKDAKTKDNKDSIEAEIKAWEQTQKEAEKEVEYYKKAAQEEIDANKQKYKIELNTAKEHKKQLETLIKGLTDAIKEQLSQQKEAALNAIESEMNEAEEAYNKECDRIDAKTDKKKAAIQEEIDALDEQKEAEDRLKEVQEANNNIAVLQAKMNNTASEADKKAYALKIKNAKAALAEKQKEWDRTDEKAALKEEQEEIEERAKRKKERLKADYEEEKEALEKKKKATEEYYETLLETDNLNAQVRYRMLNDSNQQLVQLLQSYAPYWQDAGQSLADSLINGLNSKREDMAHAVASMTELRGSLTGYASGTSYNRLSGLYNVDEKGFELSTGNNPVAYVSKGAGILNHMQSLKAIKEEVSSQVANQMQALKNLVLGQQQQMYQLAGAMAGAVNNSSSIREGDINFNVENFNNDRNDSIENIANELGFYAKRKKRC